MCRVAACWGYSVWWLQYEGEWCVVGAESGTWSCLWESKGEEIAVSGIIV